VTTIAYRAGVMAADSRAYSGGSKAIGTKMKIRRLDDGTLLGVSSNQVGLPEALANWYAGGCKAEDAPKPASLEFTLLAVKPNGDAYYATDALLITGPLRAESFAIGSGSQAAQGAMHAGADALRAVEIACMVDAWSGPPVVWLSHHGPQDWGDYWQGRFSGAAG